MVRPLTYYPEPRAVLGEAPVWDAATGRLLWVDCDRKILFNLDPSNGTITRRDLPRFPGSFGIRAKGGMIVAYRDALVLIEADGKTERPVEVPINFSKERFNDGKCDRQGRFWVGTMDRQFKNPVGALYRVDPDLSVHRMVGDITLSNGLAFSPDGRVLYHSDSRRPVLYAYDVDPDSGSLRNQRVFQDYTGNHAHPDGCTIDEEGCLWVAEIGAGCVARFSPQGGRLAAIPFPASRVTSVMFGGPGLRTLYVTSMQFRLSPEDLERQPQAGCLFAVDVGVAGLLEPQFGG